MQRGEIVLIDDNKAELRLMKESLNDTGFPRTPTSFNDPTKAYDYIAGNAKDIFIILCDIKMEKLTGPELLDKINQDQQLKMEAIPFIFLTNSADKKDVLECYKLAPQGYFQKPYQPEDMTSLFRLLINYWTAAFIPYHDYPHMNFI